MGERKVINKYIPADFDPSLIPRGKKLSSKDGTVPVRMMLPFSMQCQSCHTFLYRGRKYNSKKEPLSGPEGKYLGIQRFRFYIKCQHCNRPITFSTDPKNADYEMESGATRNFDMHRNTNIPPGTEPKNDDNNDAQQQSQSQQQDDLNEDLESESFNPINDPIKALEKRVLDSQREMAELDRLERIKAMNASHATLSMEQILQPTTTTEQQQQQSNVPLLSEQDEALVQAIFLEQKKQSHLKRLTEQDEIEWDKQQQQQQSNHKSFTAIIPTTSSHHKNKMVSSSSSSLVVAAITKKKRKVQAQDDDITVPIPEQEQQQTPPAKQEEEKATLHDLLGGYGSSSSSSDSQQED